MAEGDDQETGTGEEPIESVTFVAESWRHLLDIRLPDGNCFGIGYPQVLWISCDPSKWVVVHTATHTLHFKGRNLQALYDGLVRQSVSRIVVVPEERDLEDNDITLIHEAKIDEK